jgi:pimeloyl-ACP methyl ester carboxylesterase
MALLIGQGRAFSCKTRPPIQNTIFSMKKAARRVKIGLALCVAFFLLLPLWNLVVTRWQHAHYPVPGSLHSIHGRQMHIYCSGAGSPTVLIETGASASWLGWQAVQQQLSRVTRVCTYDRAGHGWSEPRSGTRDAETLVRELHALLNAAGVQRPLVFTGHSMGGLLAREYGREFPAEIAGVVLIDSSSPQQLDELAGERASYEHDRQNFDRQLMWERLRVWSGWERLTGNCHDEPSPELEYLAGQYDATMCRPGYVGGEDSEFKYFEQICAQAARLTSFGKVPVLVISRDPNPRRESAGEQELSKVQVWAREQEQLKSLSPLSWRVIARGAGHAVHHDRLDLVVDEIARLIQYLRGGPAPPFGSTVVE